jgi:hypothetical protein
VAPEGHRCELDLDTGDTDERCAPAKAAARLKLEGTSLVVVSARKWSAQARRGLTAM